jgi:hypothetical protein
MKAHLAPRYETTGRPSPRLKLRGAAARWFPSRPPGRLFPRSNKITAVHAHEAAHAAVAAALGLRVTVMTLDVVTVRAPCGADGSKRQAIVSAAGPAGEFHFIGDMTLADEVRAWETVWRLDQRNVIRHLDAAGGGSIDVVRAVRGEAERLVVRHWDRIMRVAAALAEHGKLTGDEVVALVGQPVRDPSESAWSLGFCFSGKSKGNQSL